MPPVVEASTTYTATSVSSIVNTKPTGLAVGDYMVHYCWYIDGTVNSYTTPSGWTSLGQIDSVSGARKFGVFAKVADSGDVAASNFTVSISATCDAVCGILLRISNVGRFDSLELDATNPISATMSFTGTSTPVASDTLVLLGLAYRSGAGLTTVSSYTTTPSNTFTEVADIVTDFGVEDPGLAVARATTSSLSQITAYGATISASKDYHVGSILLLSPVTNATGTSTLVTTTTQTFSSGGTATATGTSVLAEATSLANTQTGRGETPTQWSNESKPSTTWTNETL